LFFISFSPKGVWIRFFFLWNSPKQRTVLFLIWFPDLRFSPFRWFLLIDLISHPTQKWICDTIFYGLKRRTSLPFFHTHQELFSEHPQLLICCPGFLGFLIFFLASLKIHLPKMFLKVNLPLFFPLPPGPQKGLWKTVNREEKGGTFSPSGSFKSQFYGSFNLFRTKGNF